MDYVKKNIVNFKDFSKEEEKQELTKLKRGFVKKRMKLISFPNSKYKFNKVTRKMDELSLDMVEVNRRNGRKDESKYSYPELERKLDI
jgi:hypothetical protein